MKLCKNCRYYDDRYFDECTYNVTSSIEPDFVNGGTKEVKDRKACSVERSEKGYCGANAIFFAARDTRCTCDLTIRPWWKFW